MSGAVDEALPPACHLCGRGYPSLAALRVHAVLDERRVVSPAERPGSSQLALPLKADATSERSRS